MSESQAIQTLTVHLRLAAREGLRLADCDEEKLLLAGFVQGDRAAFERIIALHERRVARLAWRLLGWTGDVDDVVQDVFVAALEQRHKFRGDNGLWPWLVAITLNKCRSRLRRHFLRLRWLKQRRPDELESHPADRTSLREETSAKVRSAVRALSPRDREVVVLYYLEDRSVADISELLGKTENAIDVRLHRARKRLKELLEEFGG
jgi:RNA polymerase sigma-70 factor (ECF subfamily)